MKTPGVPADEDARLAALDSFDVLDTAAEEDYDALVRLASFIADTPIALISLVDRDRQWFKARVGLDAPQTGRDISFCGHAVADKARLVVEDTLKDARFADNPLVTGDPRIRFYAGSPLFSGDGQPLGTLCVIDHKPRELTADQLELLKLLAAQASRLLELRRTAARLQESREAADAVWTTSLDPLCIATFDGFFQRLSPAWTSVLGFTRDELMSQPFAQFIHPNDIEVVRRETAQLQQGAESRNFVARFRTRDGDYRALQFSSSADLAARTYTSVARDVTEARRTLDALAAARSDAEAANRAKSAFLASMSHELRTPLNSVIGFSRILLKNKEQNLGAKQLDYLERIERNGTHLLSLLNDVLDLSKIELGRVALELEDVSLQELIVGVHASLDARAVDLRVEIPDIPLDSVRADHRRLHQVFVNLVGNAIKFTPPGGTVTTRLVADGTRPIRVEVVDDGIGIKTEALERIFDPFEQAESGTSRTYGGTGLGLPIARTLTQAMGFALTAKSIDGVGSTFTVELGTPRPQTEFSQATSAVGDQTHPILIVEPTPKGRILLDSHVAALGFDVVVVAVPSLALQVAEAVHPHAVLMDIGAGTVGHPLWRAFTEHPELQKIPFVITSAIAPHSAVSHGVAPRVLLVDNDPDSRAAIREVMSSLGGVLTEVDGRDRALERLQREVFDVVVLHDSIESGHEFVQLLRKDSMLAHIPVVVFSASESLQNVRAALTTALAFSG